MSREIERKYLVVDDAWRSLGTATRIRQGYLSTVKERTVRIRVVDDAAYLTIKGINRGATRTEFEYPIPVADADQMLDELCERPLIEKTRHVVGRGDVTWEIDEFGGANAGLIIAEVELEHESQPLDLPDWVGEEVTTDPRYFNANLIDHPYTRW